MVVVLVVVVVAIVVVVVVVVVVLVVNYVKSEMGYVTRGQCRGDTRRHPETHELGKLANGKF